MEAGPEGGAPSPLASLKLLKTFLKKRLVDFGLRLYPRISDLDSVF